MERVDRFQCVKVYHCTLFSVLSNGTFDLGFHTTFHNLRMWIDEVVRKTAQKCGEHIYEESWAISINKSGPLYSI